MREGWKITTAFLAAAASGGAAWWMFRRDTGAGDDGSSTGNTAWMLGALAAVLLIYALYLVFRDVEEVIEHEVRDHHDDLQQLETFEPTLFHWALGAAAVVVLVAMVV